MMPAAFLGHGSPMNAIEHNRYTAEWSAFGAAIGKPRAVVVVSAHWFINASAVTAMARPRTIHDFYGFPQQLFDVRYGAPGAPELVDEIADMVKPTWIGADEDSWGLDHGTWSVLAHVFPDADVPVVQLAINSSQPAEYHFGLGAQLAGLRDRDVLVLGSGNIVHNLGIVDFSAGETGEPWAHRFDDAVRSALSTDPSAVLALDGHPDYRRAVPTTDHYVPMLYIAGMAAAAGTPADVMLDGYFGGSLSMTSYTVGLQSESPRRFLDAVSFEEPANLDEVVVDAADRPLDQTNI